MASEFTEAELEKLTDEEREAVTGEGGSEADADELAAETTSAEEDNGSTDIDDQKLSGDEEPNADDATKLEAEGVEPQASDDSTEAVAEQSDEKPDDASTQEAEAQEAKPDLAERLGEVDSAIDGLGEKIENGTIDFAEYNKELAKLNRERQDIVVDLRDERNAASRREEDWSKSVENFMNEDAGHKVILNNPIVQNAFQTALQQVSESKDAAGKSNNWRLGKAKELLSESGIILGTAKQEKPANKKPESRKPDVQIPKTIGDVNTAESNDNSEFSGLDGLDGMEFEVALAKLTTAQQDRYLESV